MASPYDPIIEEASRKYGIPPALLHGLVKQESGYNPRAVSPAGARGLTQLMPGTARGLGVTDPFNPRQSVMGGARYLSDQYKRFGRWDLALSAYNSGPAGSEQSGRIEDFDETQNYVKRVLGGIDVGAPPAAASAPTTQAPAQPRQRGSLARLNQTFVRFGFDPVDLPDFTTPARRPRPVAQAGPLPVVQTFRGKPNQATGKFAELVNAYLGTPYAWGGGGPQGPSKGFGRGANTVGFDCSSFLQFLWAKNGVDIPRVTYDQWRAGKAVPRGKLREGDAVFFRPGPRGPEHVGVYLGNGRFAEAPKTGDVVKISKLAGRRDYMGARRYS